MENALAIKGCNTFHGWQGIGDTGSQENFLRCNSAPILQMDSEQLATDAYVFDQSSTAFHRFIRLQLLAAGVEEIGGRHPIPRQVTMQCFRSSVPGLARIAN
jgi:hypothetical protein